ncbi:hypothetical protein Tco_1031947 [Tanacetum coccineum]|uniref:Uncharacterized protein n=1 Tax=Tanacetum coccineum TaxID=301880 RepID=A0ABQ5GAF2_9ASTR
MHDHCTVNVSQLTDTIKFRQSSKCSVIPETTNLLPIPEIPTETLVSMTLSPAHVTPTISIMQQKTTPILTPPITTETPTITTAVPESDTLSAVRLRRHTTDLIQKYSVKLAPEPSKIQTSTIDLEPESEKSASEIRKIKKEQAEKQKMPKYTIKSTDKATLKEYDQKKRSLLDHA